MTNESPGDIVGAFLRACSAADAAAAVALHGEDGWHKDGWHMEGWHMEGWHRGGADGARRDGRAAIRTDLDRVLALLPDARRMVREAIDAGASRVAVHTPSGTFELAGGRIAGTRDDGSPAAFRAEIEEAAR